MTLQRNLSVLDILLPICRTKSSELIMPPQVSCRCLVNTSSSSSNLLLRSAITHNVYQLTAFSTSTALLANVVKKKSNMMKSQGITRGSKQTFTRTKKKRESVDRSKAPAIGERKALRKRVVLSNTNALEVQGLRDVKAEDLLDEKSRGQVLGIAEEVVDRLRAVEAFKVAQAWRMYRRPAMLVRGETLDYARMMEGLEKEKRTTRRIIVGERSSGKTTMLLQAMTTAFLRNWVVINFPEGSISFLIFAIVAFHIQSFAC